MRKTTNLLPLTQAARILILLGILALGAGVARAASSETLLFGRGIQAEIHAPDQILARWIRVDEGEAWLEIPGSEPRRLALPGEVLEGRVYEAYFPHRLEAVKAALEAIAYPRPLGPVEIFILPYPRWDGVTSVAAGTRIFLSPGIAPVPAEVTHMVTAHELGHVLHNLQLPDSDVEGWLDYRRLRAIEDEDSYHAAAGHSNRPHEIFAEDFRFLFGGALANYSGNIENHDLALPDAVPGLRLFFLSLVEPPATSLQTSNFPNPFNPSTRLAVDAPDAERGSPVSVQVFDARGRLIRDLLEDRLAQPSFQVEWDGRDDAGRSVPTGVYFSRVRVGDFVKTHKMISVK